MASKKTKVMFIVYGDSNLPNPDGVIGVAGSALLALRVAAKYVFDTTKRAPVAEVGDFDENEWTLLSAGSRMVAALRKNLTVRLRAPIGLERTMYRRSLDWSSYGFVTAKVVPVAVLTADDFS